MIRVSLIISTYNRPEALNLVLESVKSQTVLSYEVIIADDGSDERTRKVINDHIITFPTLLIHSWQEDKGFRQAANKNKAVSKAKGSYLIFLDGDLIMHNRFIEDNMRSSKRNRFVVNSRVLLNEETTKQMFTHKQFKLSFREILKQKNVKNGFRIPFLNFLIITKQNYKPCRGGLLGMWRDDFYAINGMNEDFVGWGHEDTDLFIRLLKFNLERYNNKFTTLTYHLWYEKENMNQAKVNKNKALKQAENCSFYCRNGINYSGCK